MVTSGTTSPSEQVAGLAPFSYAQAAKGKSMQSSSASMKQALSSTTDAVENSSDEASASRIDGKSSWADDSADVDGLVNAGIHNKQRASSDVVSSSVVKSGEQNGGVHDSSESASSTTAKDDDAGSSQNPSSESAWDNKSQASGGVDAVRPNGEEVAAKGRRSKPQQEQVPAPLLKDAPIPAVNFWQRRAQDAQSRSPTDVISNSTKSNAQSEQAGSSPAHSKIAANAQARNDAGVFAKSSPPSSSTETKEIIHDSDGLQQHASSEGASARRTSRGQRSGLPLVRDEISWPTPESAQDEERRKASEKGDRSGNPTVSKSHGKNEWVSVPYTPSVKFNTPLPPVTKRGGRISGRGGRDVGRGAMSGNSARHASVGGEALNGQERDVSEADALGSSSPPPKSRRSMSIEPGQTSSEATSNLPHVARHMRNSVPTHDVRSTAASDARRQSRSGQDRPAPRRELAAGDTDNRAEQNPGTANIKPDETGATNPTFSHQDSNELASAQSSWKETYGLESVGEDISGKRGSDGIVRKGWSDRKNTFDGHRDLNGATSFPRERPEGRGERGRGRGTRGSSHTSSNQRTDASQLNGVHGTALPPSTPYTSGRGNSAHGQAALQQAHHLSNSRGNYRGGPRSTSIPSEYQYSRYPGYHSGQPFVGHQTFFPANYDVLAMQSYGVTPYNPYMDQVMVVTSVVTQLKYYFSIDNLLKDIFLRKHMDSQGFVSLALLAGFSRMRSLTADLEIIKYACFQTPELEVRTDADGQDRIRRKTEWEQFVLPMEERDASARNDGPPASEQPPFNYTAYDNATMRSPASPSNISTQTLENQSSNFNGTAQAFTPATGGSPMNGPYGSRVSAYRQSMPESSLAYRQPINHPFRQGEVQNDTDAFPDSEVEFLTVVVRPEGPHTKPSLHPEMSRTFSNGSIDDVNDENDEAAAHVNGSTESTNGVTDLESANEHTTTLPNVVRPGSSSAVGLFWIKGKEAPAPLPSGSSQELYSHLHAKALQQRENAATGHCPYDMNVLYQFWSHFLIRNFNARMYEEFHQLAHADASSGASKVGVNNLIKFYGESLMNQSTIRDAVAQHYVALAKEELKTEVRPAFAQLRAAWRNGALNMKNRKKINDYVDTELRAELER